MDKGKFSGTPTACTTQQKGKRYVKGLDVLLLMKLFKV